MAELFFKEESFKIIGICVEIHKILGMGLKKLTTRMQWIECIENNIPFARENDFLLNTKKEICTILTLQISFYAIVLF